MTYGDYDPRHDGPVFNSVDEYRKYEEEEKRNSSDLWQLSSYLD